MPELSVVIPAYLEEENLRLLLPRMKRTLTDTGIDFEILIIDTETALDGTEAACRDAGVTHIRRSGGNTFGAAVRTGIARSSGMYVCFMDADGSHGPEFLAQMLPYRTQYDVVIASRYVEGGHTENTRLLVMMSQVLNICYSLFLNIKCKDVSNSFKIYHGADVRALKLECENFDIVEEILVKLARRKKLSIKELPFTFKKRMFGESKRNLVAFMFTYFVTLIRLLRMR